MVLFFSGYAIVCNGNALPPDFNSAYFLRDLPATASQQRPDLKLHRYTTSINTESGQVFGLIYVIPYSNVRRVPNHDVVYVSGRISFGKAPLWPYRFVIEARTFRPSHSKSYKSLLPPIIVATGLCKAVSNTHSQTIYDLFVMNPCIYTGESLLTRLLQVVHIYDAVCIT